MMYTLKTHKDVQKDFRKLGGSVSRSLYEALSKKIMMAPLKYGFFLTGVLHPHRKLRVGEYRIVYRVHEDEKVVYIVAVGKRKDEEVYKVAQKRLS